MSRMPFVLAMTLAAASNAQPSNLLVDGSFESPGVPDAGAGRLTLRPADRVGQWRIESSSTLLGTGWQAADGEQSMELASGLAGSVLQHVSVFPGRVYELSFQLAGDPSTRADKSMRVVINDREVGRYTFRQASWTATDMGWEQHRFEFRADDPGLFILFEGLNQSDAGAVIDDVWLVEWCQADISRDGFVDLFDFDLFVAEYESGSDRADIDGDGFIDLFDLDAYVTAFERGC